MRRVSRLYDACVYVLLQPGADIVFQRVSFSGLSRNPNLRQLENPSSMGAMSLATKLYRACCRSASAPLNPKLGLLLSPSLLQKNYIAWNCRSSIACNYIISRSLYSREKEMQENMAAVRFCRALHNSSECLAEKSETEVKPDDSTNGSSPGPPPEAKSIRGSPVSWLSLGLLLVTGAGLVYYYDQEKKRLIKDFKEEAKPGPGVGKAAIGGPFKLVNHEGNEVTEQDFKGNWTLVYFGFTHCPDICPDELQKMAEAVDVIEKKDGIRITPVFISVDPERDNVEQVREYVKEFHPRLIGLTGTLENIKQVAREFRVYYMKTEEEGSDYLVDHSIIMYLMDPQMDFIKFFGKNYDVKGLADGIVEEIKRYKQ